MRFIIIISLLGFSLATELNTYKNYLIFAAKNHYKSVSDYGLKIGFSELDNEFNEFKTKFDRKYSVEEEEERKFNFLKTLQYIKSHNVLYESGDISHEVDVNQFADWSSNEYESILASKTQVFNMSSVGVSNGKVHNTFYASLPESFDWRQTSKVTAVKNQGSCGSCWAFATTATIESAVAIKYNQIVSLSEQELVDCNTVNSGCNGGNVGEAMKFVHDRGIEYENDYRYMDRDQVCALNPAKNNLKINGYYMLNHPASDADIMQAIYNYGPVAVNIDYRGDDFRLYRGGVISTGTTEMNHYVTAIGWGPNYWIVKNSWGTNWGEAGFAKIAKGHNVRGFNQWLFFPVL